MNSLDYLKKTCPKWSSVLSKADDHLEVEVCAPKRSGKTGKKYNLIIARNDRNCISVSEALKSKKLPSCCIERHINPDGSFCLFEHSTQPLNSDQSAQYWWYALGEYLNSQDHADKCREWPLEKGLSHGAAAEVQIEMENIVSEVGWKNELLLSWFRGKGWLSGALMRSNKNKTGFVNLRSPCIRGCTRLHSPNGRLSCALEKCRIGCKKLHKPILRSSCPHRTVVDELNRLENKRRQLEDNFIYELKKLNIKCCGTMDRCSLK